MWRGPHGDGRSEETDVPTRWSANENVAWKVAIPGKGHSSPVVSGDRVFVTTYLPDSNSRVLMCLDRTDGKKLWEKTVLTAPPEKKHNLNSYASATPAADGQHVYVSFLASPASASSGRMYVVCYDFAGNEVWRQSPGPFASIHGFCTSPVLYKDLLILNGDQDADAWVVALEKATGKERWRTDRPNKTRSYCTPVIADLAGKTQMVMSGSKSVASYDPETGKQYWVIDGPTEQFVASLVHTKGMVFVTGGFPDLHILGIDPSGNGNITNTHVKWRGPDRRSVSYVPSPVAHGDWFFAISDGGLATCFDAKTGKVLWKEKLGRHHSASAVASADGKLYFTSDAGETFVLKAGPKYELIGKNELGEECYASPAISGGQIFVRGVDHLYCIGRRAAP